MKTLPELARDAGFLQEHILHSKALEQFADLIRADEREACAKVADDYFGFNAIAAGIRARSNT